ncbi:type 4a pilus biogenesis protein PilO [Herbaspirillum sp. NPDC087042]|uniref:type 4a pilus biogenesis protein PilO n=1 Tax=Herbaspirillum sp. NPDC087042 TaxID=3364004 RepID=UPI00381C8C09
MSLRALAIHPAHWPLPARLVLMLACALLCAVGGLLLAVQEQEDSRHAARQRQQELRTQFRAALAQANRVGTLRVHKTALEVQLATQEEQLWPSAAASNGLLHTKLMRRAAECGLTLESFKPHAGKPSASLSLRGPYSGLLRLVELVTAPPLPVLIDSLELRISERPGDRSLLMTTIVTAPTRPDPQEKERSP